MRCVDPAPLAPPSPSSPPPFDERRSKRAVRPGAVGGPPRKEKADAPKGGPAPRTLRARLVLRRGRQLTFEVTVPAGGLDWDADGAITVLTAAGPVRAVVVAATTTHAGHLAGGTVARLTVELDPQPGDPAVLRVILGRGLLHLEIEPQPGTP